MMQGPTQAKLQVSTFLSNRMPARLIDYRNEWNRSASELPDPRQYITYEPLVLDRWPSVITIVMGTSNVVVDDYLEEDPEYKITYQMRTYVWAKADGGKAVTDMRDDLTTVIRDLLLDVPGLDDAACDYKVREDSIREEFSDLTVTGTTKKSLIAGSYVAYNLESTEVLNRDTLGIVGWGTGTGMTLTVDLIEKTPNAPTVLRAEDLGGGSVELVWNESTWEGGLSPITGYKVESSIDGGSTWITEVANTSSRDGQATLGGLTIGSTYVFRVAAINAQGTGATSAPSNTITLTASGQQPVSANSFDDGFSDGFG